MKLNRYWRSVMAQHCRKWQQENAAKICEEWSDYLTTLALDTMRERWGHPDCQSDLKIASRYCLVKPIPGANIKVQNPANQKDSYYYRDTFGIKLTTDIIAPGDGYQLIYIGHDHPEWPRLRMMVKRRDGYAAEQAAEYKVFQNFIRSTQSLAKIFAEYPWLAERMQTELPQEYKEAA